MRSRLLLLPLFLASAACSVLDAPSAGSEEDLTSKTARSRALEFDGYVYVEEGASDEAILAAVRRQTRSALGALRHEKIALASREAKDVDPATFEKRTVSVVDVAKPTAKPTVREQVRYHYVDEAIVPVDLATQSSLPSALLSSEYEQESERVREECADVEDLTQETMDDLWYVFSPATESCRSAIAKEEATIAADTKELTDRKNQVAASEVGRLYLPTTMKLGPDTTNDRASYPEYDRLLSGEGVEKGKVVVSLVHGFLNDTEAEDETDWGFREWADQIHYTLEARPFTVVKTEPSVDLEHYSVGGKEITVPLADLARAFITYDEKSPAGLTESEAAEWKKEVGRRVIKHWITLETKVDVSIGGKASKPLTVQLRTYMGSGKEPAPVKRAIKTSDVVIYNAHSYVGRGPLDPSYYSTEDFPSTYQILFFDSCVSYNYYHQDFIRLKGGTKDLDLITNGLVAQANGSGYWNSQFLAALLGGKQPSYLELLESNRGTDNALRVVDGELDNVYSPKKTPITIE